MTYCDYVLNVGPDFDCLQAEASYPTKETAINAAVIYAAETGEVAEVVYSPVEDPDYDDYVVFRTDGTRGWYGLDP